MDCYRPSRDGAWLQFCFQIVSEISEAYAAAQISFMAKLYAMALCFLMFAPQMRSIKHEERGRMALLLWVAICAN